MANTSDFESLRTEPRTGGSTIAVAGDRTRDFRKAKRHSVVVRTLRFALPALSLAFIGAYALTLLKVTDLGAKLPELKIPKILPENLTMENPHYEGFGKDGSSYTIAAKTAQQNLSDTSFIKLEGVTGQLVEADKKVTNLSGAHGIFNHETNILELTEAIDVSSDSGLKAKLRSATIKSKEGLVTSDEPVAVEFPGGSVTANSLILRQKIREVTFADTVTARLVPPARAAGAGDQKGTANGAAFMSASDAPVDITSQRLEIKDLEKSARFSGEVVAVQGDSSLAAPELEVRYSGGNVAGAKDTEQVAAAAAAVAAGKSPAPGGKISRILAKGPVTMTRGVSDRVTSESAEFDATGGTAVLTGHVVMTSGADRRALADRAELDSKANSTLLTGTVVVTSGKNELKGRRLFVDRKAQRMQLTSPAGAGAQGRISARFTQAENKKGKAAPKQAASAPGGLGMASFKTDPNAPVDIEADQLDANDAAKVAVFHGDVRARQGAFLIRTPELQATYSGEAGLADVAGTQGPATASRPAAQLTRIEAKKKVVVTSQDGQTVSGDWANFDTASNTVIVGGDVVLTQGQNVVRGTRLLIDMTSGESTIETGPAGTTSRPGGGGWLTEAPGGSDAPANRGRPSAVFYPNQLKEMRDAKQSQKVPGAAPGNWEASTAPQSSGQRGN